MCDEKKESGNGEGVGCCPGAWQGRATAVATMVVGATL